MGAYDAAMAGLVVFGMIWGAWRGLTWQLAGLASLVVGYAVSHQASAQLAPHMPGEPIVARGLSMLVVYVVVSGAIFGAAWLIRATLRKLRFEAYDRHLGMIFGGLEGAFVGCVGTLFVVSLVPQSRELIFRSPTGRVMAHVMDAAGPVLPGEIRDALSSSWHPDVEATDGLQAVNDAPNASGAPGSPGWWTWLTSQVENAVANANTGAKPAISPTDAADGEDDGSHAVGVESTSNESRFDNRVTRSGGRFQPRWRRAPRSDVAEQRGMRRD